MKESDKLKNIIIKKVNMIIPLWESLVHFFKHVGISANLDHWDIAKIYANLLTLKWQMGACVFVSQVRAAPNQVRTLLW
jgi:hypothetical protein